MGSSVGGGNQRSPHSIPKTKGDYGPSIASKEMSDWDPLGIARGPNYGPATIAGQINPNHPDNQPAPRPQESLDLSGISQIFGDDVMANLKASWENKRRGRAQDFANNGRNAANSDDHIRSPSSGNHPMMNLGLQDMMEMTSGGSSDTGDKDIDQAAQIIKALGMMA